LFFLALFSDEAVEEIALPDIALPEMMGGFRCRDRGRRRKDSRSKDPEKQPPAHSDTTEWRETSGSGCRCG
jgi:hypothetical protein